MFIGPISQAYKKLFLEPDRCTVYLFDCFSQNTWLFFAIVPTLDNRWQQTLATNHLAKSSLTVLAKPKGEKHLILENALMKLAVKPVSYKSKTIINFDNVISKIRRAGLDL